MLTENSLFSSQQEKDKILKDEETLSNIFWINVLGFLALKSYGHHSRLDLYFRSEKVQINSITDASADLMLIVKMAVENKNIQLSVGNELTKLMALIKQDKIQQVDETKFRDLVGKIILSKLTPDTIIKNVVTKFENATYTLKDCIEPLYQYAKRKKICQEFVDIAKLMVNNLDDIISDSVSAVPQTATTQLVQTMKKRGRPAGSKNQPKTGITLVQAQPTATVSSVSNHDQLLKSKVLFDVSNTLDSTLLIRKVFKMKEKELRKTFETETIQKLKGKMIDDFFNRIPTRTSNIINDKLDNIKDNILRSYGSSYDISALDKLEPIDKTYFTSDTVNGIYLYIDRAAKQPFIDQYIKFNGINVYDINLYKMYYWYFYKKGQYLGFPLTIMNKILNEIPTFSKYLKWGFLEEGKELDESERKFHSEVYETAFEDMIIQTLYQIPNNISTLFGVSKALFDAYINYRKWSVDDFAKKNNLLKSLIRNKPLLLHDKEYVEWLKSIGLEGKQGFISTYINKDEKLSISTIKNIFHLATGDSFFVNINARNDLENLRSGRSWREVLEEKGQLYDFLDVVLDGGDIYMPSFNLLKLNKLLKLHNVLDFEDKQVIDTIFNRKIDKLDLSKGDVSILNQYDYLKEKVKVFYENKSLDYSSSDNIPISVSIFGAEETVKRVLDFYLTKIIPRRYSSFSLLIDEVGIIASDMYLNKYQDLLTEVIIKIIKNESLPASSFETIFESFNKPGLSLPITSKENIDKILALLPNNTSEYDLARGWTLLMQLKASDYFIDSFEAKISSPFKMMALKYREIKEKDPRIDKIIKEIDNFNDDYEIGTYADAIFTPISTYSEEYVSKILDYINLPENKDLIPYKNKLLTKMIELVKLGKGSINKWKYTDVNSNSEDYSIENKLSLIEAIGKYVGGKTSYSKKESRKLNKEASELMENYSDIFFDLFENKQTRKHLNDILDSFGDRKHTVFKQLKDSVFVEPIINEIIGLDTPIKPLVKLDHKEIKNVLKMNNFDISDVKLRRKKNETDVDYLERAIQEKDILDVDDLKLKVEQINKTPDQLRKKSAELYKYYTKNWAHGDVGIQILEEFDATVEFEEFTKFKPNYQNTVMVPVFHGTGSIAASMILRFGFKVLDQKEANATGVGFAGRMLGNGIYVGGFVDKTCGYIRDGKHWSNKWGQVGYLLECEAVMGNDKEHHRKAGNGGDGIKSIEYCLFNARAQLKILKAYKVQVIKRKTVESWFNEFYPNGINESNTEFPSFYSFYLKEDNLKSFKEFLTEQKMPEKNIVSFTFFDDYVPISMTEQLEINAFIKRFAKKGNPIKVYESQVGNRIEIMTNSEEWLNVTIPDTDEFMMKNPEGLFHQWLHFLRKAS